MNQTKTKTLIAILTAAIMLLIPIVALAADPPAPVPKTGRTGSDGTGDDGYYQTGISSPNPRFTDNGDGTVTDKQTLLVWLKNANCFGIRIWANALTDSNTLNSGECGLTDESAEGDWRMPNRFELESLLDLGNYNPALPSGHPFLNVQSSYYWSSTAVTSSTGRAWFVYMADGRVDGSNKVNDDYVWPVRGPDRDNDGLDDHQDNCPTVSNSDQKDVDSNNIGDVCDPNTVYGTMSGDVQAGVSIEISLVSCGITNPVGTTTTNSEGYYAFGGLSGGSYGIVPQNVSYVFNPDLAEVVIPQGSNNPSYNFVASAVYTISGTVSGDIQEGVTLTLSGDSSSTSTTATDGSYSFTGVVSGNYTVTPSKTGYGFDPVSEAVIIVDADISGVNFTATFSSIIASINDNMVSISSGTFLMGCTSGDTECYSNESPRHSVTLSSFEIGRYEVTQGQWEAVMESLPDDLISNSYGQGDNYPVYSVSWNDAQTFITTLNSQTGQGYRLCTEAEWEYAARAGTETRWYCGDDESCVDNIAWYIHHSGGTTHPAGQKDPNAWGLYDMTGNVWEWVNDWYDEDYYTTDSVTDPNGPVSGSSRVMRGGGWGTAARYGRSSHRGIRGPSIPHSALGFRLCR